MPNWRRILLFALMAVTYIIPCSIAGYAVAAYILGRDMRFSSPTLWVGLAISITLSAAIASEIKAGGFLTRPFVRLIMQGDIIKLRRIWKNHFDIEKEIEEISTQVTNEEERKRLESAVVRQKENHNELLEISEKVKFYTGVDVKPNEIEN